MSNLAVIIVAAGQGLRAQAQSGNSESLKPKQYQNIVGKSSLERSIYAFLPFVDAANIQCVIGADQDAFFEYVTNRIPNLRAAVTGGAERQSSVLLGLEAVANLAPDTVLIHDAARPLVSPQIISDVIEALETHEAVLPTLQSIATIKQSIDQQFSRRTLDRSTLFEAQTPQGFHFKSILEAHRNATKSTETFTDDASIAEWANIPVKMVPGDARNLKVTRPEDFKLAEFYLTGQHMYETRTGSGIDVHQFVAGDKVRLAEVDIPHSHRLSGHSDADAALHVLTDALLGAIAEGDIGRHFPPSDPRWKGEPSRTFLSFAADRVRQNAGRIVNLDLTLMCEAPKIGPHSEQMRTNIAQICNIDPSRVSVKATTSEKMGFVGRGEGLLAHAVATVELPRTSEGVA